MNHLTPLQLFEVAGGTLSNEMEFHIRSCPECRRAFENEKRLDRTLRNLPLEQVSPNFATNVMKQIGLRESSSFAWTFLKNVGPILALFLVVGIAVTALKLSGVFEGSEIAGPTTATQSVYNDIGHGIKGGMTVLNEWISTYMSFAFATSNYGLTAFVLVFFGFIALLDKYLIMPMIRKRV